MLNKILMIYISFSFLVVGVVSASSLDGNETFDFSNSTLNEEIEKIILNYTDKGSEDSSKNLKNDSANSNVKSNSSNFKSFKSKWNNFISHTSYDMYFGNKKSTEECYQSKSFNCKDGAFLTVKMAKKYGLEAKVLKAYWSGVDHRLTKITDPKTGHSEIFDTTQKQKHDIQSGYRPVKIYGVDSKSNNELNVSDNKTIQDNAEANKSQDNETNKLQEDSPFEIINKENEDFSLNIDLDFSPEVNL
jgi:hypothetical protein